MTLYYCCQVQPTIELPLKPKWLLLAQSRLGMTHQQFPSGARSQQSIGFIVAGPADTQLKVNYFYSL